jgi:hypothetical protein
MFKFDNPFNIGADGGNAFNDGIRYHIRESEMVKEAVENYIDRHYYNRIHANDNISDLEILSYILSAVGYKLEQLTIADEHELLDEIMKARLQDKVSYLDDLKNL